jgi:Predicted transcriptional regulators
MLIDTKKDMAELLDLTPANYSRYEHQRIQPSMEMALRMAKKLNRRVEEIVYLDESPEN